MKRRTVLSLVFAVALLAVALVPLTAGGQEGRLDGATPGAATPAPAESLPDESGLWDGDGPAPRDILHLDDVIIDGSLCVGFDCVNGESFGFDTLRLKENNLRIHFDDTSTSASFPNNDWRLKANQTSNGGANEFVLEDSSAGRDVFRVEAGAPSNSLYVDNSGRLGLGTGNPVVDLHVLSGNTPTLRLEQDGSSGFAAQTWDVAGNEANFFIRDATNGSKLPLRIRPGAPTGAIDIQANGDIKLSGNSDGIKLISGNDASDPVTIEPGSTTASNDAVEVLRLQSGGGTRLVIDDLFGSAYLIEVVQTGGAAGGLRVASFASGVGFVIDSAGSVTVENGLTVVGGCSGC